MTPAVAPREVPSPVTTELPAPFIAPVQASVEGVQTAMTECDQAAAKKPFVLHFLVAPIVTTESSRPADLASDQHGAFDLVASKSTLDGLRNKTLTINATPYRFAISDSGTGKTLIWSATNGVSKFTHTDNVAFAKFRVGFDVPGKGPQWSNEYARRASVCYWVNAYFNWK